MAPNTLPGTQGDKSPEPYEEPASATIDMNSLNSMYQMAPLREPDSLPTNPNQRPPKADPEVDELTPDFGNGVDDGFLPQPKLSSRRPSLGQHDHNHDHDFDPELRGPDSTDTPTPDVNVYQQKKTLAQGMMDLALLSANANQLRYVLETGRRHPYYFPSLVFIGISLTLQIAVGVGLILNSRYNVKVHHDMCRANKLNNFTVIGIFIVTITNVFISAFGVGEVAADS